MQRHAFTLLHDMEHSWWYRGRSIVVQTALSSLRAPRTENALDFGAGFGGMVEVLKKFSTHVCAFEPDTEATAALQKRGYSCVFDTPESAFSNQWGLIGLFDVLEHIENDASFLSDLHHVLVPGGTAIFSVPAFQWLWGPLDVQSHHYRRYTKKQIVDLLRSAGYTVAFASYWNMFLFPLAAAVRLLGHKGEGGLALPPLINAVFLFLISVESFIMRFVPLPFGLSIVVCATRQKPAH